MDVFKGETFVIVHKNMGLFISNSQMSDVSM